MAKSLQQRAIDIAHETHLGLTKTKALIREKIWFPNIDKMVKETIDNCITYQAVGKSPPQEPISGTTTPKGPWETVHIDFYGPLPTGEYLLVAIDRYSRYPEVEVVRSTKASTVIPKLDQMFARHGIPTIIKSDNGPPFNGTEYKHYLEVLGIKAKYSTPKWPQGNAEAERFMQPLGKALKTAHIGNRPWQQELSRFLLLYRTCLLRRLLFTVHISGVYRSVAGIGFCDDASWEGERRKNKSLPNRDYRVSKLCEISRKSANWLFLLTMARNRWTKVSQCWS